MELSEISLEERSSGKPSSVKIYQSLYPVGLNLLSLVVMPMQIKYIRNFKI